MSVADIRMLRMDNGYLEAVAHARKGNRDQLMQAIDPSFSAPPTLGKRALFRAFISNFNQRSSDSQELTDFYDEMKCMRRVIGTDFRTRFCH